MKLSEAVPAPEHAKRWSKEYLDAWAYAEDCAHEWSCMDETEERTHWFWWCSFNVDWQNRKAYLRRLFAHNSKVMDHYADKMKALSAELGQAVRWETAQADIIVTPGGEIRCV